MTKSEFLEIAHTYKSRDLVEFHCACCGKLSKRVKKNILKSLKDADSICCSSGCSDKIKHPRVKVSCNNCGKDIERPPSHVGLNNFCGSSCAASFNNRQRVRTEDSKRKTSETLREYHSSAVSQSKRVSDDARSRFVISCAVCNTVFMTESPRAKYCSKSCSSSERKASRNKGVCRGNGKRYCSISFHDCLYCGNKIIYALAKSRSKRKTCSEECQTKYMSKKQSDRLSKTENRNNLGRHKKSYLEASFENWLVCQGVDFETEVHYRNTELNKSYYVDFLFKDKSLVIELDGTQHRKTVEKDKVRDEYLTRVHGLTVVRITHKEYREKSRLHEICELLDITIKPLKA